MKEEIENLNLKTPYFLLSEKRIRENCKRFFDAFSKHYNKIRVYYSVKTNYEIEVLKIIKDMGFGGEISGSLDLFFALKAGIKPENIIFDGPCKPDKDLVYALKEKIYLYNFDSFMDGENFHRIHKKLFSDERDKVGFRVYPELKGNYMSDLAVSYAKKFGVPYSQVKRTYFNYLKYKDELDIASVSTNIGSQILTPKYHVQTLKKLFDVTKYLESKDVNIEEINLGGGYPSESLIKTTPTNLLLSKFLNIEREPISASVEDFGETISEAYVDNLSQIKGEPHLALEPGRSIVSDAGVYVCKVVDKKDNFLFIDGTNNHMSESLFFAKRQVVSLRQSDKNKNYIICGRTLNTADIISYKASLPENISIGETVLVLDAGAYTFTKANQFTLLRCPIYMLKSNGKVKKIRREETPDDILRLMS